jgi:glycosyltransferase involved in cell wall biosynthesis
MTRCARERRVFYIEEPVYDAASPYMQIDTHDGVTVAVPHVPAGTSAADAEPLQRRLLDDLLRRERIDDYLLWYYTPMALAFTGHLTPLARVYDCMDELSAFKDAPSRLAEREAQLLKVADLVLTGGQSLYEAKRHLHHNIHPFPSSVDVEHFARARRIRADRPDQAAISRPRLGFFGVIDERLDVALIDAVASCRPDWQIVLVGPVVKIDRAALPQHANIHYLGPKTYAELPHYAAGWDVAILPFARNDATRFISPTKTPEYMAAGRPVVSTSIRDVVRPYGQQGLVRIADDASEFVAACAAAMAENATARLTRNDAFLRHLSWDGTWQRIRCLVDAAIESHGTSSNADDGATEAVV